MYSGKAKGPKVMTKRGTFSGEIRSGRLYNVVKYGT